MTTWMIDNELIGERPFMYFARRLGRRICERLEENDMHFDIEDSSQAEYCLGDLGTPVKVSVIKGAYIQEYNITSIKFIFRLDEEKYIIWMVADYKEFHKERITDQLEQATFEITTARGPENLVYCANMDDLKDYYDGFLENGDWSLKSAYHGNAGRGMDYRVYAPMVQSDVPLLMQGENQNRNINIRPLHWERHTYDPADPAQIRDNKRSLYEILAFSGIVRNRDGIRVGTFYYLKDEDGRERLRTRCAFVYRQNKLDMIEFSDVRRNYVTGKYEVIECEYDEKGNVKIPRGTILGGIWADGMQDIGVNSLKFESDVLIKTNIESKWQDIEGISLDKDGIIKNDSESKDFMSDNARDTGLAAERVIRSNILEKLDLPDSFVVGLGSSGNNVSREFDKEAEGICFKKRGNNIYRASLKSEKGTLSLISRLRMNTAVSERNPVLTQLPYPEAKEIWYQYTLKDGSMSVKLSADEMQKLSLEFRNIDVNGDGTKIIKHLDESLSVYLHNSPRDYSNVLDRIYKDRNGHQLWMGLVSENLFPVDDNGDEFLTELMDMLTWIADDLKSRPNELSESSLRMLEQHPNLQRLIDSGLNENFDNNNIGLWEEFARIWIRYTADVEKKGRKAVKIPKLCFLGDPGTGKNTTARKLAGLFGKELTIATPSDIKGGYVGWTKKELLNLIKDAAENDRIVLIDEFYQIYSDVFGREAVTVLLPILSGDKTSFVWENYKDGRNNDISETRELDLKKTPVTIWLSGYEQDTRKVLSENPGLYRRMKTLTLTTPSVMTLYEKLLDKLTDVSIRDYIDKNDGIRNDIQTFLGWAAGKDYSAYFGNYAGVQALADELNVLSLLSGEEGEDAYPRIINGILEDHRMELRHQHQAVIASKSGKKYEVSDNCTSSFDDVIGCKEAKKGLKEISDILTRREVYQKKGVRVVKGTLLVGPPGTGKTLFAKALAGDIRRKYEMSGDKDKRVAFIPVAATELNNADEVKQLFYQAGSYDTCVVFIDEIDAIGGLRTRHSNPDTLIQLLKEMDGFEEDKGIFVLAATNAPETLDPALTRPGRFDRIVKVGIPALDDRKALLEFYLSRKAGWVEINRNNPDECSKVIDDIARRMVGYTPAEIENLANETELLKDESGDPGDETESPNKYRETMSELIDRRIGGPLKDTAMEDKHNADELLNRLMDTAIHEVGHALITIEENVSETDKDKPPFERISILPRERTLGFVALNQEEEKNYTKKVLMSRIRIAMGGRAAEEVVSGADKISAGASVDIQQATSIATRMVFELGMSDEIGPMTLRRKIDTFLASEYQYICSEELRASAEREVETILKAAYKYVKDVLAEKKELIKALAVEICEKENMTGEEFMISYHKLLENNRAG